MNKQVQKERKQEISLYGVITLHVIAQLLEHMQTYNLNSMLILHNDKPVSVLLKHEDIILEAYVR